MAFAREYLEYLDGNVGQDGDDDDSDGDDDRMTGPARPRRRTPLDFPVPNPTGQRLMAGSDFGSVSLSTLNTCANHVTHFAIGYGR
jgi:hypothetical protein